MRGTDDDGADEDLGDFRDFGDEPCFLARFSSKPLLAERSVMKAHSAAIASTTSATIQKIAEMIPSRTRNTRTATTTSTTRAMARLASEGEASSMTHIMAPRPYRPLKIAGGEERGEGRLERVDAGTRGAMARMNLHRAELQADSRGDVVVLRPGPDGAHALRNASDTPCRVLMLSTLDPVYHYELIEEEWLFVLSDKVGVFGSGVRSLLRRSDEPDWDGERPTGAG